MGLKRFDYKIKENKKTPIIIAIVIIMALLIGVTVYMTQAKYKVTNSYNILKGQISNFSPIQEGTLAYDIVSNYGGFNKIEQISYELLPQASEVTEEDWFFDDDNFWYGTSYEYDSTTQQFSLSGTLVQATLSECMDGTKTCGKYTLKSSEENYTATSVIEMTDISNGNPVKITRTTLANAFTTGTKEEEAGLYSTPDDYGTSYYFRGNPTNNYVELGPGTQYAGCYEEDKGSCLTGDYFNTEAECLEKYAYCDPQSINNSWQIVRINGDGTIRMIYSETIEEGNYNNSGYSTHVGYMFGTTNDPYTNTNSSAIKSTLDTWYSTNLNKYAEYIADSIFCNDREISNVSNDTTYYMANTRMQLSTPKLTCTQQNDRFTVDDTTYGNGALTYPIGLLTIDEYVMAGKSGYGNAISFLGYDTDYWTMTPYSSSTSSAGVYGTNGIPNVTQSGVYPDYRPVINLKLDVAFTGTGTIDDPYVIGTN